jgi:hypothetical protein
MINDFHRDPEPRRLTCPGYPPRAGQVKWTRGQNLSFNPAKKLTPETLKVAFRALKAPDGSPGLISSSGPFSVGMKYRSPSLTEVVFYFVTMR